MPKNYNWRIKRENYELVNDGIITLLVKVGYPDIKKVCKGDTITFVDYSYSKFEIVRVTQYSDFSDMLDNEDSTKAVPGISKYKALDYLQSIYPEEKESLGVYVFEILKQSTGTKIYTLSSFINNHKLFGKLAHSIYIITDDVCKYHSNHFQCYWTQQIPKIFNGTGEIVFCTSNNKIVGVTFLEKDQSESKISTFTVIKEYRERHIAYKMLDYAFNYLGTVRPLITISETDLPMFKHFIERYNWKLSQTLNKDCNEQIFREFVYNGKHP